MLLYADDTHRVLVSVQILNINIPPSGVHCWRALSNQEIGQLTTGQRTLMKLGLTLLALAVKRN